MIPVLPLRFRFRAREALRLPPYPGSLWRGALGARLRQDACITGAPGCEGCGVRLRCAYGRLYEPPAQGDAPGLAGRFRDPPRPYVISPAHAGGDHAAGEALTTDVTLVGRGAGDALALQRAAARLELNGVALELTAADALPPAGDPPVALATAAVPRPWPIPVPPAPGRARLTLEHPLRLRHEGQYLDAKDFSFEIMFTTVLRRISGLAATVTDAPIDCDFATLKAHAANAVTVPSSDLRWFDWSRSSSRQGRRVPMGGLVGSFTVSGDLAPLWPWLWTGQWLHVGKGAVMGMGRYRIQPLG